MKRVQAVYQLFSYVLEEKKKKSSHIEGLWAEKNLQKEPESMGFRPGSVASHDLE